MCDLSAIPSEHLVNDKQAFSDSKTSSAANGKLASLTFGMPRTDEDSPRSDSLKFLDIPEKGMQQFQEFAKALKTQMSRECAESNPYVQALVAQREAIAQ